MLRAIRRANGSGPSVERVEREHGDGIRASHPRGERRDGRAQQVHPGVVPAHHRPTGDRVLTLLHGLRPAQLEHPCPQATGRAQLGDGEELVVGRGIAELEDAHGVVEVDPVVDHPAQVVDAGGQGPAELLGLGGTDVVSGRPVGDQAQGADPQGGAGDRHGVPRPALGLVLEPAPAQRAAQRVGSQVGAGSRHDPPTLDQLLELEGRLDAVDVAREEDDRGEVEQHPGERLVELVDVHQGRQLHPEGGHAALEVGQRVGVGQGELAPVLAAQVEEGPHVPRSRPARAAAGSKAVEQGGRAEGRDVDPVVRREGQPVPGLRIRLVGTEPPALAQHPGRRLLPVLAGRRRTVEHQRERALLGLERVGLGQAALDGVLRGHAPTLGGGADPSHTL